jgi:hypothetical protein
MGWAVLVLMITKFELGMVVMTPGARDSFSEDFRTKCLEWHASGDWGDMDPEDVETNEEALRSGGRLMSAYKDASGATLWIVSEEDRTITTMLLSEEY